MTGRRLRVAVVTLVVCSAALGALPAGANASLLTVDAGVAPNAVETGSTTSLQLYAETRGIDTADGSTSANVTFTLPAGLDLSKAAVESESAGPNATAVDATIDASAGTVVVEWDDDGGVADDALNATVTLSGVAVTRSGTHTVTVALDYDGDGAADFANSRGPNVTATAPGSDRTLAGDTGEVFLGEEAVDVTGLTGVAPAGSDQTFHGTGDAAGTVATVADTSDVDVSAGNGFADGGYATTPGGAVRLVVTDPQVSDVTLYTGTDTSGSDVTNGSFPESVSSLTVDPTFNFAGAENATLVVVDDDGLNVTETVAETGRPRIGSGETETLDVSGLPVGTYTVRVEGRDDLSAAAATTTFTVRGEAKTISVDRTRVERSESVVVTVTGAPGNRRYVRIHESALQSGKGPTLPVAEAVFDQTERVVRIDADAETGYLYATVSLDDEGFARVRLQTDALDTGTHSLQLATTADADAAEDDVSLVVVDQRVAIAAPETATVGETIPVDGTALGSETVKLYARVDDAYRPLYADADTDTLAEADVDSDGAWETRVDTARVLDVPDAYRLVVVADPGTYEGTSTALDAETMHGLDATNGTTVRTVAGSLSASVTPDELAATGSDEATISGTASGQGDELRLYVVGPRGTVTVREVGLRNDSFTETVGGFETRGEHRLLLVGRGRDRTFAYGDDADAVRAELTGEETQSQALETLRDAYSGPGVDDQLRSFSLRAANPTLAIDAVDGDDRVTAEAADAVAVAGTSNREPGATVVIRVEADGETVAVTETRVDDDGTWTASVDLSSASPGTYTVRADDGVSTATRTIERLEVRSETPVESTTASATTRETKSGTQTTAATTAAETATTATETTTTTTPGFGVVVGLLGFLVSASVARRMRG